MAEVLRRQTPRDPDAPPVLMGARNSAVDHGIFVIGVCCEMLEHPLPDTALGPTAKPSVHLNSITEPLRQISPWHPCAITIQHRLMSAGASVLVDVLTLPAGKVHSRRTSAVAGAASAALAASTMASVRDSLRPRPMTLHRPQRAHPPQRADATSLTIIAANLLCDSASSSAADLNGRRSPVQRNCTRSSGTLLA